METDPKGFFVGRDREREKNPPLDHASARIVTELAVRLLPPLQEALSEARSHESEERDAAWREIREAVSEMRSREDEERDAAWREIREVLSEMRPCEDRERDAAWREIREAAVALNERAGREPEESPERWETLSRTLEEMSRRLSALEERVGELATRSRPPVPEQEERKAVPPPSHEGPLSQLMENRIPAWEGLLRAHNQAQSRELNALSTELAELQNETRLALTQTLRQELSDCAVQEERRLDALLESLIGGTRTAQRYLRGTLALGALVLLLLLTLLSKV